MLSAAAAVPPCLDQKYYPPHNTHKTKKQKKYKTKQKMTIKTAVKYL